MSLGGCIQLPVVVTRCEWIPKAVRTGGISGPLHQEWTLEIGLRCEEQPVRLAAMLLNREAGQLQHVRASPDAGNDATYRIHFFPYDWHNSDDVQVNVEGTLLAVESHALTREPNMSARLLVEVGDRLTTGAVVDVVSLADSGWVAQVALLAQSDTKKDRTRWHIRCPGQDQAGIYEFLWSGRRTGHLLLGER